MIELRKKRIEDSMDQGGETPALYQVIPEKKTNVGGAMMGSAHIYDMTAVSIFIHSMRVGVFSLNDKSKALKCLSNLLYLKMSK